MEHVTSLMYYLPSKPAVTDQVLKGGPEYTVFAKETQTARSRTKEYGANYPKVSQAIWTAIQAAITGTSSVSSALQTAQGTISGVQQVSGTANHALAGRRPGRDRARAVVRGLADLAPRRRGERVRAGTAPDEVPPRIRAGSAWPAR